MAFTLPSETVASAFLPTFRAELAESLDDRGMTQREIAAALGVSQPAVSQYVAGEVDVEPRLAGDPAVEEAVDRLADRLAEDTIARPEMLAEVVALVRSLQDRGTLCELHEEEMPSLQGLGCDVCVRGSDQRALAERRALHGVREATRLLEDAGGELVELVPAVGTNVAEAPPSADGVTDVAAVPGRITAMRGRIHVPSDPEFGASHHVASVLLGARDGGASHRGAINLATSDDLLATLADAGLAAARFDAESDDRRTTVAALFRDDPALDVVYHEGADGLEAVTYVLGSTAADAVARVRDAVA